MIHHSIRQMQKMLTQLDTWLTKATEYAKAKPFDVNTLLTFRFAPDQFAFARQVQVACDTAKLAASRLTGKEAPKHADDEQTIEALQARVRSVVAWLDGFKTADFAGAEQRTIQNPRWEGKVMVGQDYLQEHAMPNFFFHLVHAYAMLRHNGVGIGKLDYLGPLTLRPA